MRLSKKPTTSPGCCFFIEGKAFSANAEETVIEGATAGNAAGPRNVWLKDAVILLI